MPWHNGIAASWPFLLNENWNGEKLQNKFVMLQYDIDSNSNLLSIIVSIDDDDDDEQNALAAKCKLNEHRANANTNTAFFLFGQGAVGPKSLFSCHYGVSQFVQRTVEQYKDNENKTVVSIYHNLV